MEEEVKYSQNEPNVLTKEIRGLSIRNLIAIIVATATIVGTVLLKNSSLEGQIRDIRNDFANYGTITDMRFINLQNQIDENKKKIDKLANDKPGRR